MKLIGCFALLLLVAGCVDNVSSQNNVLWGGIGAKDILLYQYRVTKAAIPGEIVSAEVRYPLEVATEQRTITAVRMTDQHTDGNGGYPTLINGGPGHKNVAINFLSSRGNDIHYILEVFGRQ